MLHIIGLDHRAQARKPGNQLTGAQQAFADCLRRTIEQVRPIFIAEEDNEEALAKRCKVSIAKEIADEEGIEHRFCDPNGEQRKAIACADGQTLEREMLTHDDPNLLYEETVIKALAIEMGQYYPIRERFWYERLDGCRDRNAVFICGACHIDSFGRLLKSKGVPFEVVERGIGLNEEDILYPLAVKYLNEHPELRKE